jgi:hypothetical protein
VILSQERFWNLRLSAFYGPWAHGNIRAGSEFHLKPKSFANTFRALRLLFQLTLLRLTGD